MSGFIKPLQAEAGEIETWKDFSNYLRNGRGFSKSEADQLIYLAKRLSHSNQKTPSVAAKLAARLRVAAAAAHLRGES